jgi:hypothetical protein
MPHPNHPTPTTQTADWEAGQEVPPRRAFGPWPVLGAQGTLAVRGPERYGR